MTIVTVELERVVEVTCNLIMVCGNW